MGMKMDIKNHVKVVDRCLRMKAELCFTLQYIINYTVNNVSLS